MMTNEGERRAAEWLAGWQAHEEAVLREQLEGQISRAEEGMPRQGRPEPEDGYEQNMTSPVRHSPLQQELERLQGLAEGILKETYVWEEQLGKLLMPRPQGRVDETERDRAGGSAIAEVIHNSNGLLEQAGQRLMDLRSAIDL